MSTAPTAVPCGIHTIIPNTHGRSRACGGSCDQEIVANGLVHYRCPRCGHRTARHLDGTPLRAWDGLLRDGTPYAGSSVTEHDWRL
jgi:hypothetical protein